MKRIVSLIAIMLVYMLPVLTIPAYAASHAKADKVADTAADQKKKKEGEEEEEPECD